MEIYYYKAQYNKERIFPQQELYTFLIMSLYVLFL